MGNEPVFDERILYLSLYPVIFSGEPELYEVFRINLGENLEHLSKDIMQSILHLIYKHLDGLESEDRKYWKEIFREINHEMIHRFQVEAKIKL